MNGKDTHVRGLRVLGPLEYVLVPAFRDYLKQCLTGIFIVLESPPRAMIRSPSQPKSSRCTSVLDSIHQLDFQMHIT